MSVSVIVPAYNEAQNIVSLVDRIIEERDAGCPIDDIIVVASGCTDDTATLARDVGGREPAVLVLEQPLREGKASAINLGLVNAKNDVIVLISGDVLPDRGAVTALVAAMQDQTVGVAGARPVPRNDAHAFTGFAAQMMWRLHHRINEHAAEPKCGEMIAFRRALDGRPLVPAIPVNSAVDEVSIQSLIREAGLRSVYVPSAIVRNWGPATVRDWARQRRRINAGHLLSAREG